MSTRPPGNAVAVWYERPAVMDPVAANVPVVGSQISAEARGPDPAEPPVMRTRPSDRSVAVWPRRAVVIEPVGLNVPVVGS